MRILTHCTLIHTACACCSCMLFESVALSVECIIHYAIILLAFNVLLWKARTRLNLRETPELDDRILKSPPSIRPAESIKVFK